MKKKIKYKAYFYGCCDITATTTFLKSKNCIFNEFKRFHHYFSFQSSYWAASINGKESCHPFVPKGVYPENSIFNEKNKIMVLTVLCDPIIGNYVNQKKELVRFGYPHLDATKIPLKDYPDDYGLGGGACTDDVYQSFTTNYSFKGMTSVDEIIKNFETIINSFSRDTQFVILLGPTFESKFGEKNKLCQSVDMKNIYKDINHAMVNTFTSSNIHFIDPNKFYKIPKKKSDLFYYNFPSILHYPRSLYKAIAKEMHNLFPGTIKYDCLFDLKRFFRKKIQPKLLKVFKRKAIQ